MYPWVNRILSNKLTFPNGEVFDIKANTTTYENNVYVPIHGLFADTPRKIIEGSL